jgi:hypothetical protein
LQDRQLLELEFVHENPEKLEGLLELIPDTDEVPEIEFSYDTTLGSGERVRCRHCKKTATNHNRGFVLKYLDGSRVLVGKDCGAKQFGERFAFKQNQFAAARKRADLLRRKAHIIDNRVSALGVIEAIEGYGGWREYGLAKRSYRNGLWFAVADLADAVTRKNGRLYRKEEVRDHAAEDRRARAGKGGAPILAQVDIELGVLAGGSFFEARLIDGGPEKAVTSLTQRLKPTIFTIDDDESNHELELKFKGIDNILDSLVDQVSLVSDAWAAMSEANLDLLVGWLTANHAGSFRRHGAIVYRHDAANNVVNVARGEARIPARFDASTPSQRPPIDRVAELRSLLRP